MIRFIDLTNQITDDSKEFAFWCTTTNSFFKFEGNQTWDTIEEFRDDCSKNCHTPRLNRFLGLIPSDFFKTGTPLEKEIREAYVFLRAKNNTIPSVTINFMLKASLERLKSE